MFPSNAKPSKPKPKVRRPIRIPIPRSVLRDPATHALERNYHGAGEASAAARLFPPASLRELKLKRDKEAKEAVRQLIQRREQALSHECQARGMSINGRKRLSEMYEFVARPAHVSLPTAGDVVADMAEDQAEKLRRREAVVRAFVDQLRAGLQFDEGDWVRELVPPLLPYRVEPTPPKPPIASPAATDLLTDALRGEGTATITHEMQQNGAKPSASDHSDVESKHEVSASLAAGDRGASTNQEARALGLTPEQWHHVDALRSLDEQGRRSWYECLVLRPHPCLARLRAFVLSGVCDGADIPPEDLSMQESFVEGASFANHSHATLSAPPSLIDLQAHNAPGSASQDSDGGGGDTVSGSPRADRVPVTLPTLPPGYATVSGVQWAGQGSFSASTAASGAVMSADSAIASSLGDLPKLPGSVVIGVWHGKPAAVPPGTMLSRWQVRQAAQALSRARQAEALLGVPSHARTRGRMLHLPGVTSHAESWARAAGVPGAGMTASTALAQSSSAASLHGRPLGGVGGSTLLSHSMGSLRQGSATALPPLPRKPEVDASSGLLRHSDLSVPGAATAMFNSSYTVFPPGVNPDAVLSCHAILSALVSSGSVRASVAPSLAKALGERTIGGLTRVGGAGALVDAVIAPVGPASTAPYDLSQGDSFVQRGGGGGGPAHVGFDHGLNSGPGLGDGGVLGGSSMSDRGRGRKTSTLRTGYAITRSSLLLAGVSRDVNAFGRSKLRSRRNHRSLHDEPPSNTDPRLGTGSFAQASVTSQPSMLSGSVGSPLPPPPAELELGPRGQVYGDDGEQLYRLSVVDPPASYDDASSRHMGVEWVDVHVAAAAVVDDAFAAYGRFCERRAALRMHLVELSLPASFTARMLSVPAIPLLTHSPPSLASAAPHGAVAPAKAAAEEFLIHGLFRGEPAAARAVAEYLWDLYDSRGGGDTAKVDDNASSGDSKDEGWSMDDALAAASKAPLPACIGVLRHAPPALLPEPHYSASHHYMTRGSGGPGASNSLQIAGSTGVERGGAATDSVNAGVNEAATTGHRVLASSSAHPSVHFADDVGGDPTDQVPPPPPSTNGGDNSLDAGDSLLLAGDDAVLGLRHTDALHAPIGHPASGGGSGSGGDGLHPVAGSGQGDGGPSLTGDGDDDTLGPTPSHGLLEKEASRRTLAINALAYDAEARWRDLLACALTQPTPLAFLLEAGAPVDQQDSLRCLIHDERSALVESPVVNPSGKRAPNLHRFVWAIVEAFCLTGEVNLGNLVPGYSTRVTFTEVKDVAAAIGVETAMRQQRLQKLRSVFRKRGWSWLFDGLPTSELEDFVYSRWDDAYAFAQRKYARFTSCQQRALALWNHLESGLLPGGVSYQSWCVYADPLPHASAFGLVPPSASPDAQQKLPTAWALAAEVARQVLGGTGPEEVPPVADAQARTRARDAVQRGAVAVPAIAKQFVHTGSVWCREWGEYVSSADGAADALMYHAAFNWAGAEQTHS